MSNAPSASQRPSGGSLEALTHRLMRLDRYRRHDVLVALTRAELVKLGQHVGMACDNRWTWLDLHDTLQTVLDRRARSGVQLDMFEAAADEAPLFDE